MFGLIRFAFSLIIFAIVVWFAVTVPLGSRTLWGHLRAIGNTEAAHELAEGTKVEARKVAERLLNGPDGGAPEGKPLDEHTTEERRELDKLVKPGKKKH